MKYVQTRKKAIHRLKIVYILIIFRHKTTNHVDTFRIEYKWIK